MQTLDFICEKLDRFEENLSSIAEKRRDLIEDSMKEKIFRRSGYARNVALLSGLLGELVFDYCLTRILENYDLNIKPNILHKSIEESKSSVLKKGEYAYKSGSINSIEIISKGYTWDIDCLLEIDNLPVIFEVKTGMYQQKYSKREKFTGEDITAAINEKKISRLVDPVKELYSGIEPSYVIVIPKDGKLFMQRDPNYLNFLMQGRKVTSFNSKHEDFKHVAKKIVESPRMEVIELIKSVEDIKRIADEYGSIMEGDIIEVQPRNIMSNLLEFFRKQRKREI